jgi:hypothetical protein
LKGLGSAAATPGVLDALAGLLRDQDGAVRFAAAAAAGGLGSAAATPGVLDALADLLRGGSWARVARSLGTVMRFGVRFVRRRRWLWWPRISAFRLVDLSRSPTARQS